MEGQNRQVAEAAGPTGPARGAENLCHRTRLVPGSPQNCPAHPGIDVLANHAGGILRFNCTLADSWPNARLCRSPGPTRPTPLRTHATIARSATIARPTDVPGHP